MTVRTDILFNTLSLNLLTRQLFTANLSYFEQINGENSSVTNHQLFSVNQNYQRSYGAERQIYFCGMPNYLPSIETYLQYDAVSAEDDKNKIQFNPISPDFFGEFFVGQTFGLVYLFSVNV